MIYKTFIKADPAAVKSTPATSTTHKSDVLPGVAAPFMRQDLQGDVDRGDIDDGAKPPASGGGRTPGSPGTGSVPAPANNAKATSGDAGGKDGSSSSPAGGDDLQLAAAPPAGGDDSSSPPSSGTDKSSSTGSTPKSTDTAVAAVPTPPPDTKQDPGAAPKGTDPGSSGSGGGDGGTGGATGGGSDATKAPTAPTAPTPAGGTGTHIASLPHDQGGTGGDPDLQIPPAAPPPVETPPPVVETPPATPATTPPPMQHAG